MSHSLVIGMTESGKTTLAKLMAAKLKVMGIRTAVLDPLRDDEWVSNNQFTNSVDFLDYVKTQKSMVLFVDEGGHSIGRYNSEMEWLATQSRHWGHSCIFISQGVTQLSPIIRQQCAKFYVFACGESNAKIIAEECNEPVLKDSVKLQPGEFFTVSRFTKIRRSKIIFPESGRLPLDKLSVIPYDGTQDNISGKNDDNSVVNDGVDGVSNVTDGV